MTDLVLEHLKNIQGQLGDIRSDMREVKARLGSIESYIATLHGDQTRAWLRLDDLAQRG